MFGHRASFLTVTLLLSACTADTPPTEPTPEPVPQAPVARPEQPQAGQGRGRQREVLSESDVDFRVTNPTTGASMAIYLDTPSTPPPYKAIVVVPGGGGDASSVFNDLGIRQPMLDRGIAVVRYDPEGRGLSSGIDDLNGEAQQAGLRAVIQAVIDRDDIADDQVGVFSHSYGITLSAGALAEGQTGARFLIDWEGPSDRHYIAGCEGTEGTTKRPFPEGMSCGDEDFWAEREATRFIAELTVPYLRIQRQRDHVHEEDAGHAYALYELARTGKAPWVRMNDLEANLPVEKIQQSPRPDVEFPVLFRWYPDWVEDMFIVIEGGTPPARDHVAPAADEQRPRGKRGGGKQKGEGAEGRPPRGEGGGGRPKRGKAPPAGR